MEKKYLMKCGHLANALNMGKPLCLFCEPKKAAFQVDREIVNEFEGLEGRFAVCRWCNKRVKSRWSLPYFEPCPKEAVDSYYCGCGGWD